MEVISGEPFDEFVQRRILQPLGMKDTGFTLAAESLDRLPALYRREGDAMAEVEAAGNTAWSAERRVPWGGHGLASTASDYIRFALMLVNGGELDGQRILGRKTVELMFMNHLHDQGGLPLLNEPWVSKTENRSIPRVDGQIPLRSGELQLGLGYGYGGYVIMDVAQNAVPGSAGTYGWGGNSSTYFFIDPAEDLVAVFLTQLTPSSSYPLRAQFRSLVYQALTD